MSSAGKKRKWKRWAAVAVAVIVAAPLALAGMISSGLADPYLRRAAADRIGRATGGSAELDLFHFDPWRLRLILGGLTIRGSEPAGTPPMFHADRVEIALGIDSWWGRKISLRSVDLLRPSAFIRFERTGSSNVPVLASLSRLAAGSSLREPIFALSVRQLRFEDGELLWNDVRVPLVAEGGNFDLSVDLSSSDGQPAYLGQFRWQQMQVVAQRYLPFPSDVSGRFTLGRDSLDFTQLVWTVPHASLDAQFSLSDFANPAWSFRYRGGFDFEDLRTILRQPQSPSGHLDFNGDGRFAGGKLALSGRYSADGIGMGDQWFHAQGIASRGTYSGDENGLQVPDFSAQILGGTVNGKVQLDLHTWQFRADSHVQGVHLAALFAALDNPNLPIAPLHWDGAVDVQAVTTWTAGFQDLDSRGVSVWSPPASSSPGKIPVNARIDYHYSMAAGRVTAVSSEITTPSGGVQMNGALGARDSSMDVVFDTQDLAPWDDFINVLRGANVPPERIAGRFHWQGRITGPLIAPTFTGHVKGADAAYGKLYWDELEGDMAYSPDFFRLVRASARRGGSSAQIEASLAFDDWSFDPNSAWSLDATLVRTDTDGLQLLLGLAYPVHGVLSGDFHGKGTRANPELTGLFDVINPQAWSWRFDRARGELAMSHGEISISKAELRLLPPPAANGSQPASPPGVLTGNFLYRIAEKQATFDVTGAALPLEGIADLQTPRLPIGGRLTFQLTGQGSLLAPKLQGSLRLIDLRLGSEVLGSFDGKLDADGAQLNFTADSAITSELHGSVRVSLAGDYPLAGQVTIAQMDLDPLIIAALHLDALTGQSRVDGQFSVAGSLLHPEALSVDGNVSNLSVEYQHVKLQNTGPLRFQYSNQEIRIQQAALQAADSAFTLTGSAQFAGEGALNMRLAGTVDLSLFGSLLPGLAVSGPAQVDGILGGTASNPRVTGRVHVQNASVRYGDFPVGLSQVGGDFVFDASRMVFDNVTAQAGGGNLQVSGSVTYGNGPLRFDLTARTDQVRVPYPAGMRWLTGGTLRLLGTPQSATLSGSVTVDRLLMEQNFDLGSMLGSSTESAGLAGASSAFLRNLQLDIQAASSPNASLQWSSGSFQGDGNVRLRGTWDRPIVLGNIRLLNGQMSLRGNQYHLSRGDIDFVNPFRLDPELNIEATTTIQSYEITVDFTGTASHPVMSQRSDPPLPQSDIITLLAVGQTGQESQLRGGPAAAQTPETGATTLLSEAVSSQLGGRLQRLFGISHFSVDPSSLAETSTGTNPAMRVTVAQQFAHNLVITYSTDVTSTQQQVIQIEYTVSSDISIVALRDENGTFGVDVVRHIRFK